MARVARRDFLANLAHLAVMDSPVGCEICIKVQIFVVFQAMRAPKARSDCPETLAKLDQRGYPARMALAMPKVRPGPKERLVQPEWLAMRDRPESVAMMLHLVRA